MHVNVMQTAVKTPAAMEEAVASSTEIHDEEDDVISDENWDSRGLDDSANQNTWAKWVVDELSWKWDHVFVHSLLTLSQVALLRAPQWMYSMLVHRGREPGEVVSRTGALRHGFTHFVMGCLFHNRVPHWLDKWHVRELRCIYGPVADKLRDVVFAAARARMFQKALDMVTDAEMAAIVEERMKPLFEELSPAWFTCSNIAFRLRRSRGGDARSKSKVDKATAEPEKIKQDAPATADEKVADAAEDDFDAIMRRIDTETPGADNGEKQKEGDN